MCTGSSATLELADIIERHGEAYRIRYRPNFSQQRVMRAITACRTAAMGGHVRSCDRCGFITHHYHSCRNRHCPKCQTLAKERWIEARQSELLNTRYDHVVFTLPHDLNPLIQGNPRLMYNLLFRAVADTLLTFGRDRRWIGGEIGITLVLHTWGQNLGQHVHIHGLVTAGGLSGDGKSWRKAKKRFLFPVHAMSKVFRAKYLDAMIAARRRDEIAFGGSTAILSDDQAFTGFIESLKCCNWVVYAKQPFAGPGQIVNYLGRYTHRIAISNHRIVAMDGEKVSFKWRDYRDNSKLKVMRLKATEFIRRFLLHVLPSGFMRIRHYGLLANRYRRDKLARCRMLLGQPEPEPLVTETTEQIMERLTGSSIHACPHCGEGRLSIIETLPRTPP
ncbi:MAG: IS91 family transposase [Planctomycetaceae bacterium]|nr:IS91 family transposase [Planctomycetaceae bacterium]